MKERLLKPAEIDVLFRYPTGRTIRLARQNKIPFIELPDGEIRIRESFIQSLIQSDQDNGGKHE